MVLSGRGQTLALKVQRKSLITLESSLGHCSVPLDFQETNFVESIFVDVTRGSLPSELVFTTL